MLGAQGQAIRGKFKAETKDRELPLQGCSEAEVQAAIYIPSDRPSRHYVSFIPDWNSLT